MASNFNAEGFFPLSSTPIQSLDDSGYVGSGQKRNLLTSNKKALNAFSPIQEFLPGKVLSKNVDLEQDSILSSVVGTKKLFHFKNIPKYEQCSNVDKTEYRPADLGINNNSNKLHNCDTSLFSNSSELGSSNPSHSMSSFTEVNSIDLSESNNSKDAFPGFQSKSFVVPTIHDLEISKHLDVLKSFECFTEKSRFKKEKYDFIYELKQRNCYDIITSILSYLSPEELCKASCVNKEWNRCITKDIKANKRKKEFIKERTIFLTGPCKENRLGMRCGPAREHKKAFSTLTNSISLPAVVSHAVSQENKRFDSFLIEGKKSVKLLKCPKCYFASKLRNKKIYICTHCFYEFCSDCYSAAAENHSCCRHDLPSTMIGSKRSLKNLRRL